MEDFADKVVELRKSMQLTQNEFALKIGATAATVSSWERGLKVPSISTAVNIATTCGVSIDWLCGLTENKRGASIAPVETMRDLFEAALRIAGKSKHVTISRGECTYAEAKNIHKRPQEEGESDMSMISYSEIKIWEDEKTNSFFDEWSALRALYIKKVIPENVYFLWVEKKLEEFEKVPSPTVKPPEEFPF